MLTQKTRRGERASKRAREREEGRDNPPPPTPHCPLAPLCCCFFFFLPWPCYVNWASQECCFFLPEVLTPVLRPSFVLFFSGFSLPSLLATTILDSFFLFQLLNGLNPGLAHCRRILYQLSHKRSPSIVHVVPT